jgi:hypothetical protein
MTNNKIKQIWTDLAGIGLGMVLIHLLQGFAFWLFYNLSVGWLTGLWINLIQVIAFVVLLKLIEWIKKS